MLPIYRQEDVFARTATYVSDLTLREKKGEEFSCFRGMFRIFSIISKFQNSNDVLRNPYWETLL